jgi:hypothetical protein
MARGTGAGAQGPGGGGGPGPGARKGWGPGAGRGCGGAGMGIGPGDRAGCSSGARDTGGLGSAAGRVGLGRTGRREPRPGLNPGPPRSRQRRAGRPAFKGAASPAAATITARGRGGRPAPGIPAGGRTPDGRVGSYVQGSPLARVPSAGKSRLGLPRRRDSCGGAGQTWRCPHAPCQWQSP